MRDHEYDRYSRWSETLVLVFTLQPRTLEFAACVNLKVKDKEKSQHTGLVLDYVFILSLSLFNIIFYSLYNLA